MNKIYATITILSLVVLSAFLPQSLLAQIKADGTGIDPRRLIDFRIFESLGVINIWSLTPDQIKGYPNCPRGETDCNRCTADVVGQFRKISNET